MQQKIVDYKLVSHDNYSYLDKFVNKSMDEGYEPYGHPFSSGGTDQMGRTFSVVHQAMVKYCNQK